ncbi:hypothetical protein DYT72_24595 [Escherichia coli]|nr:hypothetical protein [Escherichia coli]
MSKIWPDNNAPELIPTGYVKVSSTHNLPVFSCVPQAQYMNRLTVKFCTISDTKTAMRSIHW